MKACFKFMIFAMVPISFANAADTMRITSNEVAGFKIGMKKSEITAKYPKLKFGEGLGEGCSMAKVKEKNIDLMLEDQVLTRIYIENPTAITAKNIHVGSTRKQTIKAYGKALKVEERGADEIANHLTLHDRQGLALRFDTDGKIITEISIGTETAIGLMEGCS